MNQEKIIFHQKPLFSKKECDIIISLNKQNEQIWKNTDRDYKSFSIVYNKETSWIFERLKTFFEDVSGYQMIELKEEIHFHIFDKNSWFGKHNDAIDRRIFSVGVLLNDNFEGGNFKLFNPTEIILEKKSGNCYIFDVSILHEIEPIESGVRYSLIWFIQNNNIKTTTKKMI